MKGLPTNENTAKPELQYAARHSPRIESKKKAIDQTDSARLDAFVGGYYPVHYV
jgi:hypothetical protein